MGATAVVAATAVGSHRDREEDGGSLQGSAPLLLPVCDAIIVGWGRERKWGGGDEASSLALEGEGATNLIWRAFEASVRFLPRPSPPLPVPEQRTLTLVGEI